MKETVEESEQFIVQDDRLRELLGPSYVVKRGEDATEDRATIYKIVEQQVEKKPLFGKAYVETVKEEAFVARADYMERDEEERTIYVEDECVYEVMKQFGNEFGYHELMKCWPGAGKGPRPKPKKKMTESFNP